MGERRGMKALELWSRKIVGGYRDVQLDNMTSSWRDGLAFCAIIHHFRPDLVDFDSLSKENIFYNNNLAFTVAEQHLGIPALLDAEDMVTYKVPDKLSIMTYLSQLYKYFHGMEESPKKSPSKRSLEEKDTITALAEPPGKLPTPSPAAALPSSPRAHRRGDACHACKNRIYILERLIVDNKLYHRTCFKCHKCLTVLHPGSYVESKDSSDTYECLQCPSDEDRCDKSRLATTVALRSFLEHAGQPPRPEHFARSARGSVASKLLETPRSSEVSLTITDDASKARSEFCSDIAENARLVQDLPTPFDDTGQCPPPLPMSAAPRGGCFQTPPSSGEDSATGADVRNNNLPPQTYDQDKTVGEANAVNNDLVPCPDIIDVCCKGSNGNLETVAEIEICVRKDRAEKEGDVVSNELGVTSGPPIERKSVSEMIKMFAANKERGEMQRVAVVRPQMPAAAVMDSRSAPRLEEEQMQTKPENPQRKQLIVEQLIVPRAAPRAHRKKSNELDAKVSTEEKKPPLEIVAPVAKRRTMITSEVSVAEAAVVGEAPIEKRAESPPPPKPPRFPSTLEEVEVKAEGNATDVDSPEYPDHLNPFGEDDDDNGGIVSEKKALNPFGSSDEDNEDENKLIPGSSEVQQNVQSSLNPFSSDSDSDADEVIVKRILPPVPASRISIVTRPATPPPPPPLNPSLHHSVDPKTMTMGRKKRLAPLPPAATYSPTGSGSGASSPLVTPLPSPRTTRRMSAPPRPPPVQSSSSVVTLCVTSTQNEDSLRPKDDFDVSSSSILSAGDNSIQHDASDLSETKSLKELDNMNITKASVSSSTCGTLGNVSCSSDSQLSPSKTLNTFGYWKRKKPAPAVPVPRRRQIRKLPLAEIQAELIHIEESQLELEKQGVQIEMIIREKFSDDVEPSVEEESLIMNLFELVNKKNALFRRQAELIYLKRQQRLEEEHADLEFQIRCLLEKPANKKTDEDRELEDKLIARLVDVVHQRSEIIESMEMDRLREAEEDQSIQERMYLQRNQLHTGSMSSQGSFGSIHSTGGSSLSKAEKSKADKRKDKKKSKKKKEKDKGGAQSRSEVNDEDKDLDESEASSISATKTKEKKKMWFL